MRNIQVKFVFHLTMPGVLSVSWGGAFPRCSPMSTRSVEREPSARLWGAYLGHPDEFAAGGGPAHFAAVEQPIRGSMGVGSSGQDFRNQQRGNDQVFVLWSNCTKHDPFARLLMCRGTFVVVIIEDPVLPWIMTLRQGNVYLREPAKKGSEVSCVVLRASARAEQLMFLFHTDNLKI